MENSDRFCVRCLCAGQMELIEDNLSYKDALVVAASLILKYHVVEIYPRVDYPGSRYSSNIEDWADPTYDMENAWSYYDCAD